MKNNSHKSAVWFEVMPAWPVKREHPELPTPKTLEQRIELQIIVFLAYAGTAVLTGWMEYHGPRFLPLLPLILIISVLIIVISRPKHPHILNNITNDNRDIQKD